MKFSVWDAFIDPRPLEDFEHPDHVVEARNATHAAELVAAKGFDDEAAFVVRDEQSGRYFEIELHKEWECDLLRPVRLEDVSKS